jgi:hypothetical protein
MIAVAAVVLIVIIYLYATDRFAGIIWEVSSALCEHIVVANDNNLPYSAGRKPNVQDDNEFILLRVPELLGAR